MQKKKRKPVSRIIVIVARPAGSSYEFLQLSKSNHWQPVAGHIDPKDGQKKKPVRAAAGRELREEAGLSRGKLQPLGIVDRPSPEGHRTSYAAQAYLKVIKPGVKIRISKEHSRSRWSPEGASLKAFAHSERFTTALQRAVKALRPK